MILAIRGGSGRLEVRGRWEREGGERQGEESSRGLLLQRRWVPSISTQRG